MRAVVCSALTGIDAVAVRADWPEPVLRAGQACVAVKAAALNYPDLLMLTGSYQHRAVPPFVLGMEGAGVVTAVADDVDATLVGRSVMMSARGTCAEHAAVDVAELLEVPIGWSMAQAAAFPVAAKTAWHALVHRARLQAGDRLIVHGASGGTGHMAIKVGKALGAYVVATTADPAKAERLKQFGADAVVSSVGDDLGARLKDACGGRGADVVFDPIGGAVFEASLKAAAFGARLLIVGFVAKAPNEVRTNYTLIKGLSILGVRAGEAARCDPTIAARYREELPALAQRAGVAPHVDAVFDLVDTAAAFRRLEQRAFVGKLVIQL